MARLDPFIELLYREKADVLLLETGQPAVLVTGDQVRAAMQRPLSTSQIAAACAELAPGYLRETFSVFEESDFQYQAPGGGVRIRVEPQAEGVRATFEPVAPPNKDRARPRVIELAPDVAAPPPPAPKAIETRAAAGDAAAAMRELLDLMIAEEASD